MSSVESDYERGKREGRAERVKETCEQREHAKRRDDQLRAEGAARRDAELLRIAKDLHSAYDNGYGDDKDKILYLLEAAIKGGECG